MKEVDVENAMQLSKKDCNIKLMFGLGIFGSGMDCLLDLVSHLQEQGKCVFIATPNPEHIVFANGQPWYYSCLRQANLLIPDGVGLVFASIFKYGLSGRVKRVTGVDFMQQLCAQAADKGKTVYFFGGQSGVASLALARLQRLYPKLRGWADSGPNLSLDKDTGVWDEPSRRELAESLVAINQLEPDYLFVALGMGKQEKFIADLLPELKAGVAVGVGGAFDYLSGRVKRAPKVIRGLGFEWLYRLFSQFWRLNRQFALIKFIALTFKRA